MSNYVVHAVNRWDGGYAPTGYNAWLEVDETILAVTPQFTPGESFRLCLPSKVTAGYSVIFTSEAQTVLIVSTYRHYTEGKKKAQVALPGPTAEQLANYIAKRLNDPSQIDGL